MNCHSQLTPSCPTKDAAPFVTLGVRQKGTENLPPSLKWHWNFTLRESLFRMRVEYHVCESLLNCSDTLSVKRWATVTSAVASQGVIHSRFILFFCMSYRKTGLLHPSSPFGHHSLSSVHKPCILSRFSAPINILNLCSLAFAKGHLCYQNSILSIVSASSIVLVHLLLKTFDLFFILKFFPLLTLKLVSACVPYPLFSLCLSLSSSSLLTRTQFLWWFILLPWWGHSIQIFGQTVFEMFLWTFF